jgi:hypothetical protein
MIQLVISEKTKSAYWLENGVKTYLFGYENTL